MGASGSDYAVRDRNGNPVLWTTVNEWVADEVSRRGSDIPAQDRPDIRQLALSRIFRRAPRYDPHMPNGAKPETWVRDIAEYAVRDYREKRKALGKRPRLFLLPMEDGEEESTTLAAPLHPPEERLELRERKRVLGRALRDCFSLVPMLRRLRFLTYLAGQRRGATAEEIADALGISVQNLKGVIAQVRAELKECLRRKRWTERGWDSDPPHGSGGGV